MNQPYITGGFLYHPGARKVLLHRRSAEAPRYPNAWASFGGWSEAEDRGNPVHTWRRELREELGITLQPEQAVPLYDYVDPRIGLRRYIFYCEWPSLTMDFALGEGDGFGWFTVDEALRLPDLTDVDREDLLVLRDTLGVSGAQ